jgi:PAS domain S-box-containing protein
MSEPVRILYIDDFPLDRQLVRDALEEEHGGFHVVEAASRQEFESRLDEGGYDLVLSDFNILGFEGLDVIDMVRASDPRLAVVIVTGTGSEEIAVEAMKRGAADYVIKSPAHIRRLPHTLQAVLERTHLARQREQAQEAFRESEERFRVLVESAPVSILMVRNGHYVFANPEGARLLGYDDRERIVGLDVLQTIAPEFRDRMRERMRRLEAGEDNTPIEVQVIRVNGERRWVASTSVSVPIAGERTGVIVGQDITERKAAEAALQASQAKYRTLFSEMLAGSALHEIVCDETGTPVDYVTLEINRAYETILDTERAEVIGKRASAILPRDELDDWLEIFGPVALTGQSTRYKLYSPYNQKHFEGTAYSPAQGQFAATFHDVTDRVRAEQALRESELRHRLLFENASQGIGYFDLESRVIAFNAEAARRMDGSPQDFVGKSLHDLFGPETGQDFHQRIQAAAQDPTERVYEDHVTLPTGDRWFLSSFVRIEDANGDITGVQIISVDISDRVQAEEAAHRYTEQLEALREVGLEITSQVSLDTVLRSVTGHAIDLLDATSGSIYLCEPDGDHLALAVSVGIDPPPPRILLRRGEGLSGQVLETGEPLIVNDYRQWEGRSDAWDDYTFETVLGTPIRWGEEFLGVLNVDAPSERTFSDADAELLSLLGAQAAIAIRNARLLEALQEELSVRAQAEQALKQLYEQTRRDAETKATLLQEVHHRVKNNLQIISSLLDLQADRVGDSDVVQALHHSRHRVRSMALVHESLYQTPELARVDLDIYVEELAEYLMSAHQGPVAGVDLDLEVEAVSLGLDQAIPCGLILTELLSNALQHAFPASSDRPDDRGKPIQIALRTRGSQVELTVCDEGVGLPAHLDPQNTASLGLRIVQLLTRQLDAAMTVDSSAGSGTAFTITFPLPADQGTG